uniref:Uncharacterized protein n=1 Tax=Micrurus carvalhoi TaxID=3147026 RepID=A0A2H6MYZ9_9SAUR
MGFRNGGIDPLETGRKIRYYDVLNPQGELRTNQELREQGMKIEWWPYLQHKMRYKKNIEEFGIEVKPNQLDKILEGTDEKLISKLYNYLLEFKMAEEIVKDPMIAWAKNVGHNIDLIDIGFSPNIEWILIVLMF